MTHALAALLVVAGLCSIGGGIAVEWRRATTLRFFALDSRVFLLQRELDKKDNLLAEQQRLFANLAAGLGAFKRPASSPAP